MAYLHQIKKYDMENSWKGASVSLWFNSCPHHCRGCWNRKTWERDESLYQDNDRVVQEVKESLGQGVFQLNTLALLGGDPLSPRNIQDTVYIVKALKEWRPDLNVICWTGFTWEQVVGSKLLKPILEYLDVLVDGRFMIDRKIEGKKYGSDNQRAIDVQRTLSEGTIRIMEDF